VHDVRFLGDPQGDNQQVLMNINCNKRHLAC
jgi:hypothetical protein